MIKTLFQAPGGRALGIYNETEDFYVAQFVGKVSSQNYKQTLESILLESRQNLCTKVLINIKDLSSNPDIGKTWLSSQFIPRFYRHRHNLRLAIIKPENRIEKLGLSLLGGIIHTLGLKVDLNIFTDFMDARTWLIDLKTQNTVSYEQTSPKPAYYENKPLQKKGKSLFKIPKTGIRLKVKFDPKGRLKPKS